MEILFELSKTLKLRPCLHENRIILKYDKGDWVQSTMEITNHEIIIKNRTNNYRLLRTISIIPIEKPDSIETSVKSFTHATQRPNNKWFED